MPELGTSGSVRGVCSNAHPYRDKHALPCCRFQRWGDGVTPQPVVRLLADALSRKSVEDIADDLRARGVRAAAYHAGLDAERRTKVQDAFQAGAIDVVAATVAFGMGIDKPNVRFVAHLDAPKNLEAYYQETGRAGRDGLPADAWLCYGMSDVMNLVRLLDAGEKSPQQRRIERQKLDALIGYCETVACRRQVLLGYFGEVDRPPCGNCDNCRTPVPTWDGTVAAQKALDPSSAETAGLCTSASANNAFTATDRRT